ncbi:MAG: tRNA (guanosine(46)-N7)-methyltransferase TrmB [Hyphomicrobiaceae bacterium]
MSEDKRNERGPADLRSFGRRRGRKISGRQSDLRETLLPYVQVDLGHLPPQPLAKVFDAPDAGGHLEAQGEDAPDAGGHLEAQGHDGVRPLGPTPPLPPVQAKPIWLEIGFGGGEHLIWQAAANPTVGIIGCEPFEEGVVKVLTAIDEHGLGNIRLHPDDARPLLRWLPAASIARAFILFPDPWPKRKHQKRRLINTALLELLARVMQPGAELRIGTDIADYARTIFMAFQATEHFRWLATGPDDWHLRPTDWPQTRYEQKAVREGRRSVYLRFVRT